MKIIEVNLHDSVIERDSLALMNNVGFSATAGAVLIADLKDTSDALTGLGLVNTEPASGATGSSPSATVGVDGFPDPFFDSHFYGNTTLTVTGLKSGDTWELRNAGHGVSDGTDVTSFTAGEATGNYAASGTSTPSAPTALTGTMSADGDLDISAALVSGSYARWNGFRLTINAGKAGIPADTLQFEGAVQANLTNLYVQVVTGTTGTGTQLYESSTVTTDANGVRAPIDLSATTAVVGDPIRVTTRTADGKAFEHVTTVGDIS